MGFADEPAIAITIVMPIMRLRRPGGANPIFRKNALAVDDAAIAIHLAETE